MLPHAIPKSSEDDFTTTNDTVLALSKLLNLLLKRYINLLVIVF